MCATSVNIIKISLYKEVTQLAVLGSQKRSLCCDLKVQGFILASTAFLRHIDSIDQTLSIAVIKADRSCLKIPLIQTSSDLLEIVKSPQCLWIRNCLTCIDGQIFYNSVLKYLSYPRLIELIFFPSIFFFSQISLCKIM